MQNTRMTLFLRDCLQIIDDKYDCTKDALDQAFTRIEKTEEEKGLNKKESLKRPKLRESV